MGDGPERPGLERLAVDLGLHDRVVFAGWREDARDLVAALDVLAVPSREDGSPLVVLEALGAGVPVVGSQVGGIPDQVTDGREGLLVGPGDARALGEALTRVLRDPGLHSALGAAGRLRALQCSHGEMVDALAGHYLRLAAAARVRPAAALPSPTLPTASQNRWRTGEV